MLCPDVDDLSVLREGGEGRIVLKPVTQPLGGGFMAVEVLLLCVLHVHNVGRFVVGLYMFASLAHVVGFFSVGFTSVAYSLRLHAQNKLLTAKLQIAFEFAWSVSQR